MRDDDAPVAGAIVSVKDDKLERIGRSDSSGMAMVEGVSPGSVVIRVRLIGSKQNIFLVRVADGDNAFTITVDGGTTLDEVKVTENRSSVARHADFDTRLMHRDANTAITQAQIDKRNPITLSQMLRSVPGLRIADSLGNTIAVSSRGTKTDRNLVPQPCVMRIMVDGVVMPAYANIDAIAPKETYGIEVFNGPSRIPLALGGVRTDSYCGIIAIWTRGG